MPGSQWRLFEKIRSQYGQESSLILGALKFMNIARRTLDFFKESPLGTGHNLLTHPNDPATWTSYLSTAVFTLVAMTHSSPHAPRTVTRMSVSFAIAFLISVPTSSSGHFRSSLVSPLSSIMDKKSSSIVSKSMAIESTIVVGLGLSLGFPLAIDISMAISTIVSKSMAIVSTIVVGLSLSFSFPLGHMDDTTRVGNITASTSIAHTRSRDSSRSMSSNGDRSPSRNTSSTTHMIRMSTIEVGLGLPLSIDISMAISSVVSKSMAIVSTIVEGLGLGLSLSLRLSNGKGRQGQENQHLHVDEPSDDKLSL